ncbi:uncharacterized protein [Dermacentor albipictus]|uniref:uncharacterized protein n=1 Tax=Dermacentor albipictus TaxID=60249 RepID=UPI0038FC8CE3
MDFLKAPEPLLTTGDLRKNWQLFKQRFEIFLTASEVAEKPRTESKKTALLLSVAGAEAIEVFNTFTFAAGEKNDDYATVVKKFDEYCIAQTNEVHERYMFRRRIQAAGEPVEHFLRDLKNQARACNFGALAESMVRDQIVFGINDDTVREKLLRDNNLTLQKAEQACKAAEASATHKEMWNQEHQVHPISRTSTSRENREQTRYDCRNCGGKHSPRRCPAFGKTCRRCQRKNHFARCCKATAVVGELQSGQDDFEILDVSAKNGSSKHDWTVEVQIKNVAVQLKVDTGSQANLLPYGLYAKMNPQPPLYPSSAILRSYGGDVIKHIGVMRVEVSLNGCIAMLSFFVARKGRQAILGLEASERLGLISRVNSVSQNSSEEVVASFRHLFTGTGCVKRVYHMVLRKDATPVVQRPRRVPLALEEPLREELSRMEQAGIIAKVTEPTDWENSFYWRTCCPGLPLRAQQITQTTTTTTSKCTQSTPLECGWSPAEILQGRSLRTTLPAVQVGQSRRVDKRQQKDYSRGPLAPLNNGETVRIKDSSSWRRKARVLQSSGQPRSYVVMTEDGQLLRRNREHLLPTRESFRLSGPPHDDEGVFQEYAAPASTQHDPEAAQNPNSTASIVPTVPQQAAAPRTTRQRRPPRRLMYDANFQQVP